jgi:hypothetical protein
MALAPNCKPIVAALAAEYPQEFDDCHRPERGDRAWAFIRRVAWVLHSTVDIRFGLNGKRGNVNDPSMDAVSFRNPSIPGGVEVIDVVAGAGGPNASAAWQDVTQATLNAGTTGAYIAPEPVTGQKPPVVTPPVGETPTPPACQFQPCTCEDDIAGLYEAVANLHVAQVQQSARVEALHVALVAHLDDIKTRIERVSQELANKPVGKCKLPW